MHGGSHSAKNSEKPEKPRGLPQSAQLVQHNPVTGHKQYLITEPFAEEEDGE